MTLMTIKHCAYLLLFSLFCIGFARRGSIIAYEESADGTSSSAAVIVVEEPNAVSIKFLRYGDSLLGAQFVGEEYEDQIPFTAFAIIATAICSLGSKLQVPKTLIQLGLGVGSVPLAAKRCDFNIVDAVENSTVVTSFAKLHFGYDAGNVFVEDVSQFLERHEDYCTTEGKDAIRYSIVSQDLYMGWNPVDTLNRNFFLSVKQNLLLGYGVYVLNFVGYHQGKFSLFAECIAFTLRSIFQTVKCFRDAPLNYEVEKASNIVCFGTDDGDLLNFGERDSALGNIEMEFVTEDWIQKHFYQWEVLEEGSLSSNVRLITDVSDVEEFDAAFQQVIIDMKTLIHPLLEEHLWK